ncbi:DNA-binding XRE family transcriptional regulator [Anseongella ginsenosidimutans]|uniref:DNA-binding XRE family transcriptional regulator n=1 Tax=Anseongella ginsenosidimutans TaxID=496056 RepID=A0A4R3KW26_9SPHI|nr:helix-turn-helix transcriptional regulator [Anseongella ginsenosidimutans]QEC51362.1 helix-turn-helix transcriptional regulator [Anseongella ginsenosidimutans]TCS89937.1 DNA-binding XRE family transcriptional regulator [Anseongella ginsenosidimutans]
MKNEDYNSSRAIMRRIRLTREERRYSQEFMAGKMGISQEAYSRLELNETTPSVDRLLLMARILDIPAEELLFTSS